MKRRLATLAAALLFVLVALSGCEQCDERRGVPEPEVFSATLHNLD